MDRGQVAGAKIARQLGRIAAIGLDPPPGLNRNQRGGDDDAMDARGFELTVQHVTRGTGLVTTH